MKANYHRDEKDFLEYLRECMHYEASLDQIALFQGKGGSEFEGRRTGVGVIRCANYAEASQLADELHGNVFDTRVMVIKTV